MVLLLAIVVSASSFLLTRLKEMGFIEKVLGVPWSYAQQMIEHGHWAQNAAEAEAQRPGSVSKVVSSRP